MDKEIKMILQTIINEGFEAYIVGGYVRDYLMGNQSYDVDICTNALPKDIHNLFKQGNQNKYGGIDLKIKKYSIDITTYREEIKYTDRKLVKHKYINSLIEDLKRRDYTINTLCMNVDGKIIDLLDGKKEIENKEIRIVGNADIKFNEDPLRILRGIRFATILGFNIESTLNEAIIKNAGLVKYISITKVRSELNKILLSKNYEIGLQLLKKYEINKHLNLEYKEIKYSSDLLVMWSQIKCNEKLFTKNELKNIIDLRAILENKIIDYKVIYKYGLYMSMAAGEILGYSKKDIDEMYKNMQINDIKPLALSSLEIITILKVPPGAIIKKIKEEIINLVLENKLNNNKEEIIKYLKERK